MPHQTKSRKMSNNAQVNGDVPHSAFVEHLLAYPVVNDGLSTFRSNQYGQRSIALTDSVYKKLAVPLLPYLAGPFQYVQPYVKKADDLGDKTLCNLEERFPQVKKPTNELVDDAKTLTSLPLCVGQTGKEHVVNTFEEEFKKTEGSSLTSYGKAAITTAMLLGFETLNMVRTYLSNRGKQAQETVSEKTNN